MSIESVAPNQMAKFSSLIFESQNSVCVVRYLEGAGELSETCLKPCFPACEKKKHRDIFSQKKSLHGKFQGILGNLDNRYEIVTWGWLLQTPSVIIRLMQWELVGKLSFISVSYEKPSSS